MHVSFRLFLPTCIAQKLILSSSKLSVEPTRAVYHIREEGRHLFGLWATACNCTSTESSNSTGCLQIRRVGRAPKPLWNKHALWHGVPLCLSGGSKDGGRHTVEMGLQAGRNLADQEPWPQGPQAVRGLLMWWGPSPVYNLNPNSALKQASLVCCFFG